MSWPGGGARSRRRPRSSAPRRWPPGPRCCATASAPPRGIEGIITSTASTAPELIRPTVMRFAHRLAWQDLHDALPELAAELDHRIGDLIVTALDIAARTGARQVRGVLDDLAEAAREEARMLRRQEVARARPRSEMRQVVVISVADVVALASSGGDYLAPYRTRRGARSCCAWWRGCGPSASRPWPAWPGPSRSSGSWPWAGPGRARAGGGPGRDRRRRLRRCSGRARRVGGRVRAAAPAGDAGRRARPVRAPRRGPGRGRHRAELGQPARPGWRCATCRRWPGWSSGPGPTCGSWAGGPRTTQARPRCTACSDSCSGPGSGHACGWRGRRSRPRSPAPCRSSPAPPAWSCRG